jgi:calcineurin-like phosphoesterase family protein
MNSQKPQFWTSDWHLGHEKAIELDSRPFRNLDHMHEVLINNFNSIVPKDGVTYFLGDFGMYLSIEALAEILDRLNGTHVCILGNHDANMTKMYRMGFDVVLNAAVTYIAQQRVTMSHCPLFGVYREKTEGMRGAMPGDNWHGERKQGRFTVKDEGQFHLHGHIHSPNRGLSEKILGKQYDVGAPANGYRPVSISQIESWIAKYGR